MYVLHIHSNVHGRLGRKVKEETGSRNLWSSVENLVAHFANFALHRVSNQGSVCLKIPPTIVIFQFFRETSLRRVWLSVWVFNFRSFICCADLNEVEGDFVKIVRMLLTLLWVILTRVIQIIVAWCNFIKKWIKWVKCFCESTKIFLER